MAHVTMFHVTGGYDRGGGFSDDILEAVGGRGGRQWRKVATLTNRRSHQGISIVNFNNFAKYCNN